MAIITPSSLISEIRGSVGDVTYSRNRHRAYTKARTSPTQPNTNYQTTQRGYLSAATASWSYLTDEQRLAWNEYAKEFPTKSRLSSSSKNAGFNQYVRQRVLALRNITQYTDDPIPPLEIPEPTYLQWDATTTVVDMLMLYDNSLNGIGYQVFLSRPSSLGITSINSVPLYEIFGSNNNSGYVSLQFFNTYEARFSLNLEDYEGLNIWYKLVLYDQGSSKKRVQETGKMLINP